MNRPKQGRIKDPKQHFISIYKLYFNSAFDSTNMFIKDIGLQK